MILKSTIFSPVVQGEVTINYNKLHADPQQGKSLDIVLKKVKHRLVENMSSSTADALGLSRAILCNDTLVKKMQELQNTEVMYKGLVDHSKRALQVFQPSGQIRDTYMCFLGSPGSSTYAKRNGRHLCKFGCERATTQG